MFSTIPDKSVLYKGFLLDMRNHESLFNETLHNSKKTLFLYKGTVKNSARELNYTVKSVKPQIIQFQILFENVKLIENA